MKILQLFSLIRANKRSVLIRKLDPSDVLQQQQQLYEILVHVNENAEKATKKRD